MPALSPTALGGGEGAARNSLASTVRSFAREPTDHVPFDAERLELVARQGAELPMAQPVGRVPRPSAPQRCKRSCQNAAPRLLLLFGHADHAVPCFDKGSFLRPGVLPPLQTASVEHEDKRFLRMRKSFCCNAAMR